MLENPLRARVVKDFCSAIHKGLEVDIFWVGDGIRCRTVPVKPTGKGNWKRPDPEGVFIGRYRHPHPVGLFLEDLREVMWTK